MSTIVLVGGSFLGSWAWERVTPVLAAAGHEVHALTLTGFGDRAHLGSPETTLTTHVDDITAAIEVADLREVVLVLHSYSGVPGTVAAARIPERIARVVYVAAALPQPGKSIFDIAEPGFEEIIQQFADAEGDGWRVPVMNDDILDAYYGEHGLSAQDRAYFRARAVAQPIGAYRERVPADLSAVEKLPRTYIACSGDPGEPPTSEALGFDVATIETGHWPMITKPAELAQLIDELA